MQYEMIGKHQAIPANKFVEYAMQDEYVRWMRFNDMQKQEMFFDRGHRFDIRRSHPQSRYTYVR